MGIIIGDEIMNNNIIDVESKEVEETNNEENKDYVIWNGDNYNEVYKLFEFDMAKFLSEIPYRNKVNNIIEQCGINIGDKIYKECKNPYRYLREHKDDIETVIADIINKPDFNNTKYEEVKQGDNEMTTEETKQEEKIIYISGPVTDHDDYLTKFKEAEAKLIKQGYSVINPAEINSNLPKVFDYEDYMDIDMVMLGKARSIYMLDGWRESLGANREYGYALGMGYEIIFE